MITYIQADLQPLIWPLSLVDLPVTNWQLKITKRGQPDLMLTVNPIIGQDVLAVDISAVNWPELGQYIVELYTDGQLKIQDFIHVK
jgi:hypothetical protein